MFLEPSDSEGSIEMTSPQKPAFAVRASKASQKKQENFFYSPLKNSTAQNKPPVEKETVKAEDDEEFAELDAWLESGSVVIL